MSDNLNNIETLRQHLFETIQALRDKTNPMDINRAKAISQVAEKLIDSAKVEVAFLDVTGGRDGTGFIQNTPRKPLLPSGLR